MSVMRYLGNDKNILRIFLLYCIVLSNILSIYVWFDQPQLYDHVWIQYTGLGDAFKLNYGD